MNIGCDLLRILCTVSWYGSYEMLCRRERAYQKWKLFSEYRRPEFGLSLGQSGAAIVVDLGLGILCPAFTGQLGPKVSFFQRPRAFFDIHSYWLIRK